MSGSPAGTDRRIARHREIGAELRALGDDELVRLLKGSSVPERGHGTVVLPGSGVTVFAKAIRLTDVELRPENREATSNLFALPPYYHHRFASYGPGAWRELAAHLLATDWVLTGECPNFVLLHGWRMLSVVSPVDAHMANTERWGDHPAIQRRVAAIESATSSLVLFQEHFPLTLSQWLCERPAEIEHVEEELLEILAFLNGRGVLHLDPHFGNIFADGTGLFLGDFGLAMSRAFDLDPDERAFFERLRNFDRCIAIQGCVQAIVVRFDLPARWRAALTTLMDGTHAAANEVPARERAYLVRRGPLALAVAEFYGALRADLSADYPAELFETLLDGA